MKLVECRKCSKQSQYAYFQSGIAGQTEVRKEGLKCPHCGNTEGRVCFSVKDLILKKAVGTRVDIVRPYPNRWMARRDYHGFDNLCSTIRDIYIQTEDPEIKLWCRIAMRMSKSMYHALSDYKKMLVEKGVEVGHEGRANWQLGTKDDYSRTGRPV